MLCENPELNKNEPIELFTKCWVRGEGKHSSESLGEVLNTEQIITQINMKLIVILKMLAQCAECSENVLQEKLQGCLGSEGKKTQAEKTSGVWVGEQSGEERVDSLFLGIPETERNLENSTVTERRGMKAERGR